MTPNWEIDWERVNNIIATPVADPATAAGTTVAWIDAAGDVRIQPDEEFETEWALHEEEADTGILHTPPPLRRPARFTARIAIEIAIELWTWIVDTGSGSESRWPGWNKYEHFRLRRSFKPLCTYAFNYLRNRNPPARDVGICGYCPYKKFFGRPCNDKDTPLDLWYRTDSYPGKKKYAQAFLEELLQLQKAIILDPKSALPRSQQ